MRSFWIVVLLAGCAPATPEAPVGRQPDNSLFSSYLDGKVDSAGHPFGATVWQAETGCAPETGEQQAEGWGASPDSHGDGLLCKVTHEQLGPGPFTVNVRLLTPRLSTEETEVLTLRVLDGGGDLLASKTVRHDAFRQALTYQNLWVAFTLPHQEAVRIEAAWSGAAPVRLDYVELFRSMRRVVITPASGVPAPGALLSAELINAGDDATLRLSCDGTALAAPALTRTDFRALATGALDATLAGCQRPARLLAELVSASGWTRSAARVTYRAAPVACAFDEADAGKPRVLISGFEPFPAGSSWPNSSEAAVEGFDPAGLADLDATVMKVILPVEWDTAAAMMRDLIQRCRPDVVVGFGQGRSRVEPETTAYNRKDAADVAGGVPDNRGLVFDGAPVVEGGPARYGTGLPAAAIVAALQGAGIDAGTSDDPGRYVCNNLFYGMMHQLRGSAVVGGFVHLPRIYAVGAAERARLQTVVETVVEQALAARE
jgi:pyroglutamyl-peptidase